MSAWSRGPEIGSLVYDGSITLTWSALDHGSVTGYHVLSHMLKEGEETFIVYVPEKGQHSDPLHGDHIKAKNAHGLSDVSNFAAWIDTLLPSRNTSSTTMCHVHGLDNCTLKRKSASHHRPGT